MQTALCIAPSRKIPEAVIGTTEVGDVVSAADRVCFQGYRVIGSYFDFLCDLDRIVDFDAEISNRTFDFRMAQQKLHCAQIAGSAIYQHRLRAIGDRWSVADCVRLRCLVSNCLSPKRKGRS